LDDSKHSVTKNGQPIDLTLKEFGLLRCLMRRAGSVVPYCTLLQEVWNDPSPGERDEAVVVRVTVGRLRQELEDDPRQPTLVRTILGVGVMLNAEP